MHLVGWTLLWQLRWSYFKQIKLINTRGSLYVFVYAENGYIFFFFLFFTFRTFWSIFFVKTSKKTVNQFILLSFWHSISYGWSEVEGEIILPPISWEMNFISAVCFWDLQFQESWRYYSYLFDCVCKSTTI